jgi:hypothetical protein
VYLDKKEFSKVVEELPKLEPARRNLEVGDRSWTYFKTC